MSNDLEDFLRRAAQKRHAGEVARREEQRRPPRKPLSEYSDANTERLIRPAPEEVDETILADVVPAEQVIPVQRTTVVNRPRSRRPSTLRQASARDQAEATIVPSLSLASKSAPPSAPSPTVAPNELVAMLNNPTGIRQAFLLREILDRPEHRW